MMKCLERNKTAFYYCPYTSKASITSGGYDTGEIAVTYGTAVKVYGNISPAVGEARSDLFGNSLEYDKTIVMDNPDCPINENTVLFVDKAPAYDTSNRPLFDYIVIGVSRSLNSVAYAIRKVEVS